MKRHIPLAGDLYAVPVDGHTAYIQCAVPLDQGVALVRLLPGLYDDEPDLLELCKKESVTWACFLLSLSLSRKEVKFETSSQPITFPKMMIQQKLELNKYVVTYVDGTRPCINSEEVLLNADEAQSLPTYNLVNLGFLKVLILRSNGIAPVEANETQDGITHFLYFKDDRNAKMSVKALKQAIPDISVLIDRADSTSDFRVVVKDLMVPLDPDRLSDLLGRTASEFDGEYDGFEMADVS